MQPLFDLLAAVNAILWHDAVLYTVLATGIAFTIWTKGTQLQALTHGIAVTAGRYDGANPASPGAIHHFQALSAALSATVGLGNIGGVALAISLGGPGAVFWMWVIGAIGMALKTAEVSLSMLHRDLTDPRHPRGGPMYAARRGLTALGWPRLGRAMGALFVATLLISSITGGNMFQAWNVAEVSHQFFGVPKVAVGLTLAALVAAVILGGIRRIGAVAGRLVPLMCLTYFAAAIAAILANFDAVPGVLRSIFSCAFHPTHAQGAFLGGTAGHAMFWGLKRALFSSEAGQGSSPIAHCAARTDEPIREGIVAGLEPFIDTLVVCTLTSLVILTSGVWCRDVEFRFETDPVGVRTDTGWTLSKTTLSASTPVEDGRRVFAVVHTDTGSRLTLPGRIARASDNGDVLWETIPAEGPITSAHDGGFFAYQGASLTARAFDTTADGLGKWLVTLSAWLFALSTMISWAYYGEQGVGYLFGPRAIAAYKLLYCAMIVVATIPSLIDTDAELDALTTLGTGVMLWANVPILLLMSAGVMRRYHDYVRRMRDADRPR